MTMPHPMTSSILAAERAEFEAHLLQETSRNAEWHLAAKTTGLEFAWSCWLARAARAGDGNLPTLSDEQIDLIAADGMRNAAGGIYETSVHQFARSCIAAATQGLQARIRSLSREAWEWSKALEAVTARMRPRNVIALPPLPLGDRERVYAGHGNEEVVETFSATHMREYARQAVHEAEEAWQARAAAPAATISETAVPAGLVGDVPAAMQTVVNAMPGAQALVDNMCRLSAWWTHNRSKFTTPRQAAFAAWNESFRLAAAPAAPAKPEAWRWEHYAPSGEVFKSGFSDTCVQPTRHAYIHEGSGEWVGTRVIPLYAATAVSAPAWQPIEGAPQDGRTMLLGYPNRAGKWRTVRGQWMSADYIADNWEDPDSGEPGWYETAEEAEDIPNCWPIRPTHFMALPGDPRMASVQAPITMAEKKQP